MYAEIGTLLSDIPGFVLTQISVARRIQDSDERDTVIGEIVHGFVERGDLNKAESWALEIKELSDRGDAQRGIVKELLDRENWSAAKELAQEIEDASSRGETLLAFVEARIESEDTGRIAVAMRVVDEIEDTLNRAKAYLYLTDYVVHVNMVSREIEWVDTANWLNKTEALARTIEDASERVPVLVDLAALYVKAGTMDLDKFRDHKDGRAEQIVTELVSTLDYASGLRHLGEAYADRRSFCKAVNILNAMPYCARAEHKKLSDYLIDAEERHGETCQRY